MTHEREKCANCKHREDLPTAKAVCMHCSDGSHWEPKETPFQPEYFSGLNWREAEKLVGKVVEFSQDAERWSQPRVLTEVKHTGAICRYQREDKEYWTYIRTCPKTHQHPTITIGGVELPMPEVEPLPFNTRYYLFRLSGKSKIVSQPFYWSQGQNDNADMRRLQRGMIHLKESRAQEWADWWDETVIKAVNKC